MADRYIDNFTPGSNTSGYTSWGTAATTFNATMAVDGAGDTYYLDYRHAESTASLLSFQLPATFASPSRILSVTQAGALMAGASITVTGNGNTLNIDGIMYIYGLTLTCGTSTDACSIGVNTSLNASQCAVLENCTLALGGNSAERTISINRGATGFAGGKVRLINPVFSFANAGQYLTLGQLVEIDGATLAGTAITTLVNSLSDGTGRSGNATFSGCNFDGMAATPNLVNAGGMYGASKAVFRNCRIKSGTSLKTGNFNDPGQRIEMYNCDSGDTNYRLWIEAYEGSIVSETTIKRTGGASDGTTGLTWKMVSAANAEYPLILLGTPEIVQWNETTGSALTATIEIVTDNVTLKDDECWLEIQYLGTSGYPTSSRISDAKADVLATAANQTTSSETWTTTGLTTPVKQKLSVTFTPQEKGFVHAVVKLAKASTTVYVDPLLTIA